MENILEMTGKTSTIVDMLAAIAARIGDTDFLFANPIFEFTKEPQMIKVACPSMTRTTFVLFEFSNGKSVKWEQTEDKVEIVLDCDEILSQIAGMNWGGKSETKLLWDGVKVMIVNDASRDYSEYYPVDIEECRMPPPPIKIVDFKPKFSTNQGKLHTGTLVTTTAELLTMKKRATLADVNTYDIQCSKKESMVIVGGIKAKSKKIIHRFDHDSTKYTGKALSMSMSEQYVNIFGSINGIVTMTLTKRDDGKEYPMWVYFETDEWKRGILVSPLE